MWHAYRVKKKGINIFLRKHEQEEPIWEECKSHCLKERGWENWIVFVKLMIRVSDGFFCVS